MMGRGRGLADGLIGTARIMLGPSASEQWLCAPEHLAMVLARYRAAAALIGNAADVLEVGCGEGIGARLLAAGRTGYVGIDPDTEAIETARLLELRRPSGCTFHPETLDEHDPTWRYQAAVALDVIEHIPALDAERWLGIIAARLTADGVCVIGTPNHVFDALASPKSKALHVCTYTHHRLQLLMDEQFRLVQSFGMQDTALHLGHPDARHYLLMCGIGPRS